MAYEEQFAALSHPLRQQILTAVQAQPLSVRDLTDVLGVSQPVVSQHLKVLREAGLIDASAEGTRRIYRIEKAGLAALRDYLTAHWGKVLGALDGKADRYD